jgi:hypothetical protein
VGALSAANNIPCWNNTGWHFWLQADEQVKTAEEKRATCVALVTLVTSAPSSPWKNLAFTRKDR